MNKKILKYILVTLFLMIFLVLGILGLFKKTEEIKEIKIEENIKTTVTPFVKNENILVFNNKIKDSNIPVEIKKIIKESSQIDEKTIEKLVQSFGFENSEKIEETTYETYESDNFDKSLNIDKQKNIVEYNVDLLASPLKTEEIKITEEEIKNKAKELVANYLGLNNLELSFNSINYLINDVTKFEIVDKNKANCVELKINYLIDGYPVYYLEGFPLTIIFDGEGNLINLKIIWPEKITKTEFINELKKIDEIQTDQFELIISEGEFVPEIKDLENNFLIKKNYLGLISLENIDEMVPSLILEGTTKIEEEEINITIAAPIFK